jgi:hypothetical protein
MEESKIVPLPMTMMTKREMEVVGVAAPMSVRILSGV